MTEKKKETLFDQFPPVSTEEWKAKVEVDLKGAPFDKKLVWRTNEGFNVQPMYRAEDIADLKTTDSLPGEFPYVRGTKMNNDWLSRQEIIAETPEQANEKALDVPGKGINSLGFKVLKKLLKHFSKASTFQKQKSTSPAVRAKPLSSPSCLLTISKPINLKNLSKVQLISIPSVVPSNMASPSPATSQKLPLNFWQR